MRTFNISLPDPLAQFVEEQLAAGDYANASEYFRDIVRGEQKRQAKQQLEQVLLAAITSEDPDELTSDLIEETSKRFRTRNVR